MEYLTTGNIMNGWKRPDDKPVDKPGNQTVNKPDNQTVNKPDNQPVTQPVIIPNQLNNNDYRDTNRPSLRQTTLDQYQKNITGTKTNRLNNEQQALLALMKRQSKPIPITSGKRTKRKK